MEGESFAASISFQQLRLFESVGRLESVRQGSEECNLSQPAVTQALSKLERQVGFSLLERRASGSYLTEAGKILHLRTRRMFAQLAAAVVAIGGADGVEQASAIVHRLSRSQARALIGIMEHSTLSDAAIALKLTEASLQRSTRDIEGNIGRPLFYRAAVGLTVRPEGMAFGRKLKLAMQEIESGLSELSAMAGGRQRQIVIGALPFGGVLLLADVLKAFLDHRPDADIRVVSDSTSEMIRRLRAGEVDILLGIVQEDDADDLRSERLIETPFCIVARRDHPLDGRPKLNRDDLAGYDWIVGTEGSTRRACFNALFGAGTPPRSSLATSSLTIIRKLLAVSDRLTIITSFELQSEADTLIALPYALDGENPSIGVTMRADWLPTGLQREFLDTVIAVAG
ncbi:MAG: LysR substrate-binding domain-containing protein [Novosphingobium sp.]|uniref:LysR substrate-binding domain-containing protein n=1 Tax=Novosphingobium sp. TaxID=1874826 RepID=UPI003B9AEADC